MTNPAGAEGLSIYIYIYIYIYVYIYVCMYKKKRTSKKTIYDFKKIVKEYCIKESTQKKLSWAV